MTKELSEALLQEIDEESAVNSVESIFASYQGNDVEKKSALDQACRDVVKGFLFSHTEQKKDIDNISVQNGSNNTKDLLKTFIKLVIQLSKLKHCTNNLTIMLLSDTFEALTLNEAEEMFSFVEENVSTWVSEPFFSTGKNHLLRMCNDILRRLSKSQNTIFCGRIQLFLAQLFPIEEKSALNLNSNFHTENVTIFQRNQPHNPKETKGDGMEEGEVAINPVDYNLYVKFWSLQEFFREPPKCYTNIGWGKLKNGVLEVLKVFESQKLEFNEKRRKSQEENVPETLSNVAEKVQNYFAKYLTNEKLLNLQINDSNFRRYFLVQVLIVFQYLNGTVKFKGANQTLSDSQSKWIKEATEKVYLILSETPPNGSQFAKTVKHILTREENWINWKNEGCSSFARNANEQPKEQPKKAKRRGIGEEYLLNKKKRINMGNAELSRLWNLHPDNLEACKQENRLKFLPTLENFFEEAIEQGDPAAGIEEEYKVINNPNFQWKSLRLLARRSHHFFTPSTTPFKVLPDYLKSVIDNISDDIKRANDTVKVEAKLEIKEEPEDTYVTTSQISETA